MHNVIQSVNSNYSISPISCCRRTRRAIASRTTLPPQGSRVSMKQEENSSRSKRGAHMCLGNSLTHSSHATQGCNRVGLFAGNEMRPGCISRSSRAAPASPPAAAKPHLVILIYRSVARSCASDALWLQKDSHCTREAEK